MADSWNPARYDTFAAQRDAPFRDLLSLLRPTPAPVVVDMGCGTGRLTVELAEATGAARVLGLDNSPSMLAEAPESHHGLCSFELVDIDDPDIAGVLDAPVDIVFSNAALHWMPDHMDTLARWAGLVAAGGQIAVQVPANAHHRGHELTDEVAADPYFAGRFRSDPPVDPTRQIAHPSEYAELLFELGFPEPDVRVQVYPHPMTSARQVVEWMRGTSLTRFRSLLDDDDYAEFERRYERRLLDELGDRSPYLHTFSRVLMWGGDRRP